MVLNDLPRRALLLHLLGHEPLEEDLARVVAVLLSHPVQAVDHHRHVHLVGERRLERLLRRAEGGLRGVDPRERHRAAAVDDVPDELQRVLTLLVGLEPEPAGEAREPLRLAVGGHREVQVRGVQLGRDLGVHRVLEIG
jgi:hypothetical protein